MMNSNNNHRADSTQFFQLTPDQVLDSLESVGLQPEAALLALNSYENRVYQFKDFDNQKFVVKFYRPHRWSNQQIIEEHQYTIELAEQEIPVVAPQAIDGKTLFEHAGFRFAVYPNRGGRSPELEAHDTLVWIGRFLARIHLVGEIHPFQHRPTLSLAEFGFEAVDFILKNHCVPKSIEEAYRAVALPLVEACQKAFQQFGPIENIRLHGDCHPSNIMWTDAGPHFVDFDDSRNGPMIQDLWMLVTDNSSRQQWNSLIEGYEDFREFDDRQLRLVEPLRSLRILHYSAWLARRWDDPSFQFSFPWFNSHRYWEEQILTLREQLGELNSQQTFIG